MPAITKGFVSEQKATGERHEVWDDKLPGFGLRVSSKGKKSFVFMYRYRGKKRRYTIGPDHAWTASEARVEAKRLAGEVAKGHDPAADKQDERLPVPDMPTMEHLLDRYEDEHLPTLKPKTRDDYGRWIRLYIRPHFCEKSAFPTLVDEVKRSTIEALRNNLTDKPRTCKLVIDLAHAIFEKATQWELRSPSLGNPTKGVDRPRGKKRRVYLDAEEAQIVLDALNNVHTRGPAEEHARDILCLQIHTGARRDELRLLTWGEVGDGKIVKKNHKTDTQTDDAVREIFLTEDATSILGRYRSAANEPEDDDYVFPGRRGPVGKATHSKVWKSALSLARENGLKRDDVRPHDLRHTFASFAIAAGANLYTVGGLLGHTDVRTTARYAHLADEHLRATTAKIGDVLKRK